MKNYYVYILCSKRNGTLYIGVTNNIARRILEHKNKSADSFTAKYSINHLIYCETYEYVMNALKREKQLKKWSRKMKLQLIEEANPKWEEINLN